MRNKSRNFPGPKHSEDPKAKTKYAPLKPNGQTKIDPQGRMAKDYE
jgi:hypothetical protein